MFKGKVFSGGQIMKESSKKRASRRDINKSLAILYLTVCITIVIAVVILRCFDANFSWNVLLQDTSKNLVGVMASFLIFDILYHKLTKDSYASEMSKQILNTLRYHPEVLKLYDNEQKKKIVSAFINSIVADIDVADMVNSFMTSYLMTKKDYKEKSGISERDCRIRTTFSYRFNLDIVRTNAFSDLKTPIENGVDPYFYIQEELNYTVKYLAQKGNYTNKEKVKIGFIYDNDALDRFLRGNKSEQDDELLKNCLFKESLDIEEADKKMFEEIYDKDELTKLIKKMFRPHIKIDTYEGEIIDVNIIQDCGIIVTFKIKHDINAMKHTIDIIFHIPKKWNTIVEAALFEPTNKPHISLSYNEDMMDVEMYSFLNKGESSSYDNTSENENGVYSIDLNEEWVYPISGVIFFVRRKS